MLKKEATYEQSRAGFRWQVPERYNIGVDICDKWADLEPDQIAIIDVEEDLSSTQLSFGVLKSRSNQLANALCAYGIQGKGDQRACDGDDAIGDRIGVLLPQSIETALAHIAALKMGCVSIPLFTLFGEEALRHRLQDS
ncbi:MAG: AMP-binding protein, partial [Cohaesibacter sp.]|nr:AMP-binding protein [Cohaesibacter sp.]